MSNLTSVRINVYLTQDVHTKLKHWFRAKGQTIQGGVSTTLAGLVAGVESPKEEVKPVLRGAAPAEQESYPITFYRGMQLQVPMGGDQEDYIFSPDNEYREHRAAGTSPEVARARVEFSCENYNVVGWTPPVEVNKEESI